MGVGIPSVPDLGTVLTFPLRGKAGMGVGIPSVPDHWHCSYLPPQGEGWDGGGVKLRVRHLRSIATMSAR